jgi:hypothetical protein
VAIWYISWPFGIFYGNLVNFPTLVCFTKKNLATLLIPAGQRPFKVVFNTDANEVVDANAVAKSNEEQVPMLAAVWALKSVS